MSLARSELESEREFLLLLVMSSSATSWVGASSRAMIVQAMRGAPEPDVWPSDAVDLARCERAFRLAPAHLRVRMLPTLERFRRHVARRREWAAGGVAS